MTKLMEWLLFATMFFGVWVAVIMGKIYSTLTAEWQQVILFFPLIAVFLFSAYAAITILCRVFIFNNCKNAAVELQQVSLIMNITYFIKTVVLKLLYNKCLIYFSSK